MMDNINRKIISILQKDGRSTLQSIAKEVGLSTMGVKKRLEKLLKEDIKIKALINIKNLILAIIAMEVESADALIDIVEKFKDCPRIIRFFVTTGGYNLFALIWVEDYHTLESVSLERCSLRAQKGIRRFEIYPIQEVYYEPFIDIKVIPEKKLEFAPCGVHCGRCKRYEDEKCMGCPATRFYRGRF